MKKKAVCTLSSGVFTFRSSESTYRSATYKTKTL